MRPLARLFLILAIVLFPVRLSDLKDGPAKPPATGAPPKPEAPKPPIELKGSRKIDRAAFLASFARQANTELIPCLKEALGETGSVALIARLRPSGRLTAVRFIEPRGVACATEAIQSMEFQAIARALGPDGIEVAWRFDF